MISFPVYINTRIKVVLRSRILGKKLMQSAEKKKKEKKFQLTMFCTSELNLRKKNKT